MSVSLPNHLVGPIAGAPPLVAASATQLYIGVFLVVLALIAGGSLYAWSRALRKSTRPNTIHRETVLLIVAIGLALTMMLLIVGGIILVHFFRS